MFFFKQKTAYEMRISDWSSDVCSSDLSIAQSFVHQNRIRQAASSLGAAVYCIEESVRYARTRKPFGAALAKNQAIQFPLVELATQAEMLRLLIRKTAWDMDNTPHKEVERTLSDKVSMCNYWANRLVCEASDRAMQVHGGIGYRSEENTSELQSLMRISYAVFCLKITTTSGRQI